MKTRIDTKTIEMRILDLFARKNIYKHFGCRDIGISKIERQIKALDASGLYFPGDLRVMFNCVTIAHIKEKLNKLNP
jgi:hypothetical protein